MITILAATYLRAQLPANFVFLLLPLVLIDLGLVLYSLFDLFKADRQVAGGNKLVWALVILFVGTVGPIAYLLAGRRQT